MNKQNEAKEINQIGNDLKRIKKVKYGVCEGFGEVEKGIGNIMYDENSDINQFEN